MVSAGDPSAIAAARPIVESVLKLRPDDQDPTPGERAVAGSKMLVRAVHEPSEEDAIERWRARWERAGWLSWRADVDGIVAFAVLAGNAGKIARRAVERRVVAAEDGWRALAAQLTGAGIDYAVSGLVATRPDRTTAIATNPVFYVGDPAMVVAELALAEVTSGAGVLLLAADAGELEEVEMDGGICFVSRAQGLLDALAGSGREPDKAEDMLRAWLAAAV